MEAPSVTKLSHLSTDTSVVVDHYTHYYHERTDDATKERKENAKDIAKSFYELVTNFYEYGYGESFHFCPLQDSKTLHENIADYEIELARTLGAKPGLKFLDTGSGVGGPARRIAKHTGVSICGINYSDYQIRRSRAHTAKAGLEHLITYHKGDFCNMDMFEDNSFDGVYNLEAICHAKDPLLVYKEVYRVLKPGALFVSSCWITTEKFEPGNPTHEDIIHKILVGNALPELRTRETVIAKMKKAGLEIVECTDCRHDGDIPWYAYLIGKRCLSIESFRASWLGRMVTYYTLSALEMVHIVPKGTTEVQSVLCTAADGLVASGKLDIFTPMLRVVARKPKDD